MLKGFGREKNLGWQMGTSNIKSAYTAPHLTCLALEQGSWQYSNTADQRSARKAISGLVLGPLTTRLMQCPGCLHGHPQDRGAVVRLHLTTHSECS